MHRHSVVRRLIVYFGCFALLPLSARAEALTIAAAVSRALERNPDILKAREAQVQSQADGARAVAKLFPTISAQGKSVYQKDATINGTASYGGNPYNQYQVSLVGSQTLYDGGALFAGLSYTQKDKSIKQYAAEIVEKTLTESVLESFYGILLYEHLVQIYKDAYAVYLGTLKTAEREYGIGRTQKLELLQLRTQTALLPPKIAQAQNQLQSAAAQLAMEIRDLDANQIVVHGNLVNPEPSWVQGLMAKKATELPEILQSRLLVEQVEDTRAIQMASYWPQLSLDGAIGNKANTKTQLFESAATAWSVSLNLNIPLFSGLSSIYQRRSLVSQEKQQALTAAKTSDAMLVSQVQTANDLKVAQAQLDASAEAARYGRESEKEAEREYKYKQIDYLHYQTSQQAYLDAESGFYLAKYNYIVAVAKHFNALGIPLNYLVSELERLNSAKP